MTFSWDPPGRALAGLPLRDRHVLYYFDGPKMVLAVDDRGRQLLGIAADEDDEGTVRWLFAPAAPERVLDLLERRATLRSFFERGMVEVHDVPRDSSGRSWSLSPDDVPEELLPELDAELPELSAEARATLMTDQRVLAADRGRLARTELFISGGPVRGRRGIDASFAAEVLAGYQNLVSLAHGHRKKGALAHTGPIPERGGSTLMLADMPRGSVGFELVEDPEQASILPTDLVAVVADVTALVNAAATSDAFYADAIADFDPRVLNALGGFVDTFRKANASLTIGAPDREYVLEAARLVAAAERTAAVPMFEDDRAVDGILVGLLPTDLRFELGTASGILKGRIARDADLERLALFFGKPCRAHVRVVAVARAGRAPVEAYTLSRVEEV